MKHTKNPHVVYILTKLELGGAQKVCLTLLDGMHNKEITTALITGSQGALVPAVKDKKNVVMIENFVRQAHISSIHRDISCLKEVVKKLAQYKKQYPDLIVHTHSTKAGIIGRLAAWWVSAKIVHTIHGYGFHDYQPTIVWLAIYCLELLLSPCTTHYLCVSRADAKTGIRLFPGFSNKHTIIRAAVDQKLFKRSINQSPCFPTANEPFIFGTISCFKAQKNLTDLIRAFAYVHALMPCARLEIIGDGIQRAELEKLILSFNLVEYITLHGWQEDVQSHITRWHTFVLSSLWEGLPCAVVEARLLHLPVVCYDTGGINEVIFHGHNGFLAPRGNWQLLAQHMLTLMRSADVYHQLQAYQDDFEAFDIPTMIHDHSVVYRQLIKNHTHPMTDEL